MLLPPRASNLCEAAQKCGGAGRGECEVPLCRSRRPCSHCPLEERWLRPAQGQVTPNVTHVTWPSCFCITPLPKLFVFFFFFFLQIWNPRRPYLEHSPSDVCRWGLLHLRGGKHGREVRSFCHAHGSRSARSKVCARYVITTILSLLNIKDLLLKTASSSPSEEISSCSVTNYLGSNVHLAFIQT